MPSLQEVAIIKAFNQGKGSKAIIIPSEICTAFHIEPHDRLKVLVDTSKKEIVLQKMEDVNLSSRIRK